MNKSVVVLVVLLCLTFCFLVAAYPQQPAEKSDSTSNGISLYERGDTEGEIKVLRAAVKKSKEDSKAWHYLGLALIRQGNLKDAGEALGKATDLRYKTINREFSRNEGEWRDDRLMTLKTLLNDQIESQGKLLGILTDQQALGKGELALERARVRADCMEQNTKLVDGHSVLRKSDMRIEKARVLFKPEPTFTSAARQAKTGGTVVLRAIFMADGSVRYIEPIQSVTYGLTEEAIKAASSIRFRPESICGKPVSSPVQLEYNFISGW
ncbi:MAG TPA: energy transducer TonB [Pyrinomonadaceae bacterium]